LLSLHILAALTTLSHSVTVDTTQDRLNTYRIRKGNKMCYEFQERI
jgi:hypothetical protein